LETELAIKLSTTHSINKGDISTWFKRGHLYFGLTM
jgi:hypothetical protein